jgi:hypothetical protein
MLLNVSDGLLAFLSALDGTVVVLVCLAVIACWRASNAIWQYVNRPVGLSHHFKSNYHRTNLARREICLSREGR